MITIVRIQPHLNNCLFAPSKPQCCLIENLSSIVAWISIAHFSLLSNLPELEISAHMTVQPQPSSPFRSS
jgi:hypothetical protein